MEFPAVNRSCPNCQAILKELWVDNRRAEVIDSPYFHAEFTLPHELNPPIYCNQKLLYSLLHGRCSETLLELSADKKYLRATPRIIQVLHIWNQELNYHVHKHCIISGGELTQDHKIRLFSEKFFPPVRVLRDKLKGKYMACFTTLYKNGSLVFSSSCAHLKDAYCFQKWKNMLFEKDWCPLYKGNLQWIWQCH